MPYCPECCVELEKFVRICPLCYSKSVEEKPLNIKNYPVLEMDEQEIMDKKSSRKVKRLFWDIFNLLCILSIITIIIVDFFINKNMAASKYPITSILFSWICIGSLIVFFKKPYIAGAITIICSAIFLALLDWYSGKMEWFFIMGLPLLGIIAVLLLLAGIIIKTFRLKGLNILSLVLFDTSIFCCMVNLFVVKYLYDKYFLDWSLIVFVVIIPLIIILIFIQRRLTDEIRINKIFHI